MSKQAQVGIFAILGLAAIFAVFYVISDFGTRAGGYKVGIHFTSAQGLRQGAIVNLSGVPIGAIDEVVLEPDFTTDVIASIKQGNEIPTNSKYVILAPITGEPSLNILPKQIGAGIATLPHSVLPIDQQPEGTTPQSIAELLEQGSNQVKRVDTILSQLQVAEPGMLRELQATLKNANAVTVQASGELAQLSTSANQITTQLSDVVTTSGANVNALTGSLNATAQRETPKVDALLAQLTQTTVALNQSVDSLRSVATDPKVKANLKDTAASFATTARTLAQLTGDLRNVTGNPQTQLQLRDTVANIDASTQKLNSLIGEAGGTSSVSGVDPGATPLPSDFPQGVGSPAPGASPGAGGPHAGVKRLDVASVKSRISNLTKNLVRLDVRVSELAPYRPADRIFNDSRLLTPDRGPEADFNATFLPTNSTSLFAGVNDSGGPVGTTGNFLIEKNTPGVTVGGGILYSQAGLLAKVQRSKYYGFEARAYDLRHPTLDTYLNLFPVSKFEVFGGARDVNHDDRRATFGLQFGF